MKTTLIAMACMALVLAQFPTSHASETILPQPDAPLCEETLKRQEEALAALTAEQSRLEQKIREMECAPIVSSDELLARNLRQLQELAANTRAQRQSMADFEKFVTWMSSSLAGYEKYIQAGSVAAGVAKVLPIPYAGQASMLTKFVSQGVLSLNAASGSIASYLKTSGRYLVMVDAIDPKHPDAVKVSAAARFADGEFLRAMTDVQAKLRTSADISASTLSFLETLDHYVGNSDEYWAKTKAFVTRNDAYKKDKSYLATSIEGLTNRAGTFNGRLRLFEDTARKDLPLIKNLVAYDDLAREVEAKARLKREALAAAVKP
ncbi:hypothetical protein RHDC3_02590 [Rhodocyclaceae bacterium]|nr:hypothetical protein RHDC3_02590 [Rhodocyclaceae bacterium]